jgi:hypothetical protein
VRFGWAKEIKAVAIIPRFELSTAKAREVLPLEYSRKDLVSTSIHNITLIWSFIPSLLPALGVQFATACRPCHGADPVSARSRPDLRSNEGSNSPAISQSIGWYIPPINGTHVRGNPSQIDTRASGSLILSYSKYACGPSWHLSFGGGPDHSWTRYREL